MGYIYKSGIHAPVNKSADWSLSFHVMSPRDGEDPGDFEGPLPGLVSRKMSRDRNHPYASVIAARRRRRCVELLARTLVSMDNAPAVRTYLAKCATLGSPSTDRLLPGILREAKVKDGVESCLALQRTHDHLLLSHRRVEDMVMLYAETPKGPVEQLAIDGIAHEAIAFVARQRVFEISAIPGNLSDDERTMLAEALEETGLFTRKRNDKRIFRRAGIG